MSETPRYYVPHSSPWPIIGSTALAVLAFGAVHFIHQSTDKVETEASFGAPIFYIGLALTAFMFFGWFRSVISESLGGMNSKLLDRSFRQTMAWFIVSEIMFLSLIHI